MECARISPDPFQTRDCAILEFKCYKRRFQFFRYILHRVYRFHFSYSPAKIIDIMNHEIKDNPAALLWIAKPVGSSSRMRSASLRMNYPERAKFALFNDLLKLSIVREKAYDMTDEEAYLILFTSSDHVFRIRNR